VLPDTKIHEAQSLLNQSQRIKPFPEGRNFK